MKLPSLVTVPIQQHFLQGPKIVRENALDSDGQFSSFPSFDFFLARMQEWQWSAGAINERCQGRGEGQAGESAERDVRMRTRGRGLTTWHCPFSASVLGL